MSAFGCSRHPAAATYLGLCAACLLEPALTLATSLEGATRLTVQLPLGSSAVASVFLVRAQGPDSRLLRLKQWHAAAPEGFLAGFEHMVRQFAGWDHEGIVVPFAASVDGAGRPWVLSEYRQGLPMLERTRAGRLDPEDAEAGLLRLLAVTRRAHSRGLAHGSIGPGNVIVHPDSGSVHLLDFGLAPLLSPPPDHQALVAADLAGFAALEAAL